MSLVDEFRTLLLASRPLVMIASLQEPVTKGTFKAGN